MAFVRDRRCKSGRIEREDGKVESRADKLSEEAGFVSIQKITPCQFGKGSVHSTMQYD